MLEGTILWSDENYSFRLNTIDDIVKPPLYVRRVSDDTFAWTAKRSAIGLVEGAVG